MTPELNERHRQRIALAVRAAQAGREVSIRVFGGEVAYLSWCATQPGVSFTLPNTIASGTLRQMEALLPDVQAEFARQCACVQV